MIDCYMSDWKYVLSTYMTYGGFNITTAGTLGQEPILAHYHQHKLQLQLIVGPVILSSLYRQRL